MLGACVRVLMVLWAPDSPPPAPTRFRYIAKAMCCCCVLPFVCRDGVYASKRRLCLCIYTAAAAAAQHQRSTSATQQRSNAAQHTRIYVSQILCALLSSTYLAAWMLTTHRQTPRATSARHTPHASRRRRQCTGHPRLQRRPAGQQRHTERFRVAAGPHLGSRWAAPLRSARANIITHDNV